MNNPIRLFYFILVPSLFCMSPFQFHTAIFGTRQSLWDTAQTDTLNIGILPAQITLYDESVTCDSCRWLSKNGLEFAFENYLLHHFPVPVKNHTKELIAPHNDLLSSKFPKLLELLNTLKPPLNKWFDNFGDTVIIREGDRFTQKNLKRSLSALGGQLGKTHLLWPCHIQMQIHPKRHTLAKGKCRLEFFLVFWNVQRAIPEWVVHMVYKNKKTDLNQTLYDLINTDLTQYISNLPQSINYKLNEEPK